MAQLATRELVLIADHHPEDFARLREAFLANGINIALHHLTNGEQLRQYLVGNGEYSDGVRFPMPQLVLTEWDLPGLSALELLRWVREDDNLAKLPIVAWTRVSAADGEVKEAYHLGLNAFFVKPSKDDELKNVAALISNYWKLAEKPMMKRK